MRHSNQRKINGFTLIELLVVVLIIGILSAVALPQYQAAVEKARASEAMIMLKDAHNAYDLLFLANGGDMYNISAKEVMDWSNGTWSANGHLFCTKRFVYEFAFPDIYAFRFDNIEADCSGSTNDLYYIDFGFPKEGGDVACSAYSDIGYKICKGLEAQGFTLRDER